MRPFCRTKLKKEFVMRHILVPTDFGEASHAALEHAVELCRVFHGRITLLHIAHTEKLTEALVGLDAIGYLSNALESPATSTGCAPSFNVDEWKNVARQKLEECINPAWRGKARIETALEEGRPSLKIVEYAREHSADMIVMGTHGRGPVAHFFLGSVAENVVRSADCPVLTVRSKGVSTQPGSEGR
jgi:nucleotide-binding universal stress UspA family protein